MKENNGFTYETWQESQYSNPINVGSGGDNVFTRWAQPSIAEEAQMNRENYLMDKGNAFNEYMFNKANEWNSASAQMQRGIEAGINPMLLATGIAGTGATGTPMQSQGASVGMNQNVANPLEQLGILTNGLDRGIDATDKLGKLIGFGKENKLNMKIAYNTAAKLGSEIHLNNEQIKRLRESFNDFLREMTANADVAEQNFKNLQKLFDKYKSEQELLEEQKNLVTEQVNTQQKETRQKQLQNYELEFKKAFRELFGVQLNESDASMLAQLVLNGHGEEIINAISSMFKNVFKGLNETKIGKWAQKTQEKFENSIDATKNKIKHRYLQAKWNLLGREERKRWDNNFEKWLQWNWNKGATEEW